MDKVLMEPSEVHILARGCRNPNPIRVKFRTSSHSVESVSQSKSDSCQLQKEPFHILARRCRHPNPIHVKFKISSHSSDVAIQIRIMSSFRTSLHSGERVSQSKSDSGQAQKNHFTFWQKGAAIQIRFMSISKPIHILARGCCNPD